MKRFGQFLFLVFGVSLIFYFSTCEVGLGESVDTAAPTVSITYPPVGAIIRDSFILAGKCDDDKELASVNLTISKILSSGETEKIDISVDEEVELDKTNKIWRVEINKIIETGGGYPLKDGEYTFDVVAKDASGRVSGKSSRSFKIDNTAPLFVMQSPGSKNKENPTSYGSVLKVSGLIGEEHSVSRMTFNIYKENSETPISFEETYVNTAGGTSVTYARYSKTTSDDLSKAYEKVYDLSEGKFGTDQFFDCNVELSDNAGIYKTPVFDGSEPEPDDVNDLGNKTSVVYLYDSVYGVKAKDNALLGSYAEKSNIGVKLDVSDLMKIKNGTYTGSADVEKVLGILNNPEIALNTLEKENGALKNLLPIKLNNTANPKWSVLGYGFKGPITEDNKLSVSPTAGAVSSSISFRGECGLDGTPIDPETFKLWILGPYDTEEEIYNAALLSESEGYQKDADTNEWSSHFVEDNPNKVVVRLYDGMNGIKEDEVIFSIKKFEKYKGSTVESYLETLYLPGKGSEKELEELNKGKPIEQQRDYLLETGKYYLFHAVGADADGNPIYCADENYYGFKCTYNEVAPDIIEIKTVSKKELSNQNTDVLKYSATVAMDGGSINIRSVSYDIKVTDLKTNTVLGTISTNGEVYEDNTKGIKIVSGGFGQQKVNFTIDVVTAENLKWTPQANVSKTLAEVVIPDEGEFYKYDITLTGMATKEGTTNYTTTLDKLAPVVEIQSIYTPAKTEDYENYTIYKVNGNITIQGTVVETNLDKVELIVEDENPSHKVYRDKGNATIINEIIDTTKFTNPSNLTITLKATDTSGNVSSFVYDNGTSTRYVADQETDKPTITATNASIIEREADITVGTNVFNKDTNNTLILQITDDDGLTLNPPIKVTTYRGSNTSGTKVEEKTYTSYKEKQSSVPIQHNLPKEEGVYCVVVEATDYLYASAGEYKKYHTTKSSPYILAIDSGAPKIQFTTNSGDFQSQGVALTVTGTASDSSGKITVYRYDNIDGTGEAKATYSLSGTGTLTWSDTIPDGEMNNANTVYYYAEDKYGQRSYLPFVYKVDGHKPTVCPDTDTTTKITALNGEHGWTNEKSVKITLPISDEWDTTSNSKKYDENEISGINYVKVIVDGVEKGNLIKGSAYKKNDYNNTYYEYSTTVVFDTDGPHTVKITAFDNAGNSSDIINATYKIDTVNPVLSGITTSKGTQTGEMPIYVTKSDYDNLNTTNFTISAKITDTGGSGISIDNVKLKDGIAEVSGIPATQFEDVYTFKFTGSNKSSLTSGSHSYSITAKDNAGNEIQSSVVKVYVDYEAPIVAINGVSLVATTKTVDAKTLDVTNGIVNFTGTVSDSLKLKTPISWNVDNSSDSGKCGEFAVTKSTFQSWEITDFDTRNLSDDPKHTLNVTVSDDAGNSTTESYDFFVSQASDVPTVSPINYTTSLTTIDGVKNAIRNDASENNLFGVSSNNKINATITDDDGIAKITVYYIKANKSTLDFGSEYTSDVINLASKPKTYQLSHQLKEENFYKIKIDVTDSVGNLNTSVLNGSDFVVAVSSGEPQISIDDIGLTKSNGAYWITDNKSFDVTGSVNSDALKVTRICKKGDTPISELENENIEISTKSFTDSISTTSQTSGSTISAIYTAENLFGQTATAQFDFKIDNDGPVNETQNPRELKISNIVHTDTNWYKGTTLAISGYCQDSHSGVSFVTIKIGETETTIYPKKSGDYYNYSGNISGFAAGPDNYAKITATDNAGNTSVLHESLKVQVDLETPTITFNKVQIGNATQNESTFLANGTADIVITCDVSDDASGVKGADFYVGSTDNYKINGKTNTYGTIATTSTDDKISQITLTIKANDSWFTTGNLGAKPGVYAVVEDKAGNKTSKTLVASINLDTIEPTVSFNDQWVLPVVDGKINGKNVVISGKANDNNAIDSVVVTYSVDGKENAAADKVWKDIPDGKGQFEGNCYTWSITGFDTTSTGVTDGTTIVFRAFATDKAGNTAVAYKSVIIDQDSDRPIITLNSIRIDDSKTVSGGAMSSSNPVWLKGTRTIYGTITDDDGLTGDLVVNYKGSDNVERTKTIANLDGNTKSFEFSLDGLDDGECEVGFAVKDSAEKTFNSSNGDKLNQPKIKDTGTGSVDGKLYLKLDINPPTVNISGVSVDGGTDWKTSYTGLNLGGVTKSFKVKFTVTDNNGIKAPSDTKAESGFSVETSGIVSQQILQENIAASTITNGYECIATVPCNTDTGQLKITITGRDMAGNTTEQALSLEVDNTPPVVTPTKTTTSLNGGGAVSVWGTIDTFGSKLYLAFSKAEGTQPTDSLVENTSTAWDLVTESSSMTYYLYFDDDSLNVDKSHKDFLNKYLIQLGITTADDIANNSYTAVTYLYLWLKAVDAAGNISYAKTPISVDPQGDRPSVEISYPTSKTDVVGGELRITGTAEDNEKVDSVWVQIISAQHKDGFSTTLPFRLASDATTISDYTPNQGDLDYMVACGMEVYKFAEYKKDGANTGLSWNEVADKSSANPADYAALANISGSTWNLSINKTGEFNPLENETNLVGIQVYAVDNKKNVSQSAQGFVKFDADSPIISNLYLKQFSGAKEIANRQYEDSMFVKGTWYLTGKVYDTNGINELSIGNDSLVSGGVNQSSSIIGWFDKDGETASTNPVTVEFKYELPTGTADSIGQWVANLSATDNAEGTKHEGTKSLVINYDNKDPELAFQSDANFNINPNIQQSNGFYTFGSVVYETPNGTINQSGFNRLAFYFTRTLGATTTIYDPILGRNATVHHQDVSSLVPEDGLYWKTVTVGRNSESLSVLTLPAEDKNIRAGGIVKVAGTIYRIENISGTAVTISGSPLYSAASEVVKFAIAQIVDNTTTETGNSSGNDIYYTSNDDINGYFKNIFNDDKDYMLESVTVTSQGAKAVWEASINSQNIPDGSITLHYVAFDKAGNFASAEVEGFVSNNMPRIAGLKFGTDDNGNGTVEDSELNKSWSGIYTTAQTGLTNGYITKNQKATSIIVSNGANEGTLSGDSVLKIKGCTLIKAEIVGGNNGVGYTYNVTKNGASKAYVEDNTYVQLSAVDSITDDVRSGSTGTGLDDIDFTIEKMLGGGAEKTLADGEKQIFEFKIWDQTDGSNLVNGGIPSSETSQFATITMIMDVALSDSTPPTAVIKPFYWNGKEEGNNSIYYADGNVKGHIELEGDLPTGFTKGGSGVMDRDPKVSGMIIIEGTANDNTIINELWIKIPGFNGGALFKIAERTAGVLNPVSGYGKDAFGTNSWACEIVSDEFTQEKGNDVAYKFYWNSAAITDVAALDVAIQVQAKDRGSTTWSGSAISYESPQSSALSVTQTTTATNTGYYKVDVVPYITGVKTINRGKSGLKDSNIRSASGKYSVIKGEIADFVTVQGFNFNTSNTTARILSETAYPNATQSDGIEATISTRDSVNEFKFSNNLSNSGYLEVWSNDVRAINNINNDNAKGAYTGDGTNKATDYPNMYNREPDLYTTKNITLTDDRYIRVFDMKDTGVKNGYYPTMIMDDDDPVFGYVDQKGGSSGTCSIGPNSYAGTFYPSHAMPQRAKFNGSTAALIDKEFLIKASAWDQMGMAKDEAGRYYHATLYNRDGSAMSFIYDRYNELHISTKGYGWGSGTGYQDYNGNWSHDEGNNALTLDSMNYKGLLLGRYQYPKIIAKGNSVTGAASIYMSYYDDGTGELCFRQFQIGTSVSGTATALYSGETASDGGTYAQYVNFTENTGTTTWKVGRFSVTDAGSPHFAMGVTRDNHVVIVWYDNIQSKLRLVYSNDAITGATPTTAVAWTEPNINFSEYVGNYVSLAIDSNDGIHISAFDASDSDLVYMYCQDYTGTGYTKVTVDQAGAVGNWTQIKVKNNVPYIAYYNSTETGGRESIKLAYANNAIASAGDVKSGVDTNGYTTGDWEYMTVPALTPPQGGSTMFQNVCLDFDFSGHPVVGYLGTNIEFGKALDE